MCIRDSPSATPPHAAVGGAGGAICARSHGSTTTRSMERTTECDGGGCCACGCGSAEAAPSGERAPCGLDAMRDGGRAAIGDVERRGPGDAGREPRAAGADDGATLGLAAAAEPP